MKNTLPIIVLYLLSSVTAQAQDSLKVLFLGNSYTNYNQLPAMVASMATSTGNVLQYSANTPGGYRFSQHAADATSLNYIAQGTWDYVVLQEQSQLPSFPISQVEQDVFPYARKLDSLITAANPCTETVFYTTWGRKNGDATNCGFFPPLCTYQGMDSLLQLRYRMMADSNNAILSPVAQLWRYLRTNNPTLDLYDPDGSHPSAAGSYAAACAFYTVLFRKDPTAITFNSTLNTTDAASIRAAAKIVVFGNLADWNVGKYDPVAAFTYSIFSCYASFNSLSQNVDTYEWDFGDGTPISNEVNPVHLYPDNGSFTVELIVSNCDKKDTLYIPVWVPCGSSIDEQTNAQVKTYPNPFTDRIAISTELPGNAGAWELLNAQGQLIQSGSLKSNLFIEGLGNLPNGLYLLKLQVGDKTVVKRVVKN